MIYTAGIVLCAFLSLLLLTKKNRSEADTILFIWLFVTLIHLTIYVVFSTQEYVNFPYFLGWEIPLPLVHGPFLFLYARAFSAKSIKTSYKLLHFLPYFMALLSLLPFYSLSFDEKIRVYQNQGKEYEAHTSFIFIAILLSGFIYSLLTLRLLARYQKRIKDNFSYVEKINLKWLFYLTIGLLCIWVVIFFTSDKFIFSTIVGYVLFIGFFGIKQGGIFTNELSSTTRENTESTEILPETGAEISKYEKSSLSTDQVMSIHNRLSELMKVEKLYLIPSLTLSMVSQQLDVHPNTLSQVINTIEQKNFFDYINTLRVEEFKERVLLPQNQKYTLVFLAYECGFNSKTSFNRNFKKNTTKSPSAYLKELKITLHA